MSFSSLVEHLLADGLHRVRLRKAGPGTLARLAHVLMEKGRNVVIVAPSFSEYLEYKALMSLFSPESAVTEDAVPGLPSGAAQAQWDKTFVALPHLVPGGRQNWAEHMAGLYALRSKGRGQSVIVMAESFLLRQPPADIFDDHELRLFKGMEMAPDLVMEQAVDWGYTRVPMVGAPGEAALRGDILDIFCPGYSKPLRMEFFGNTLDDIRLFDAVSQRSVADLPEMHLLPVAPVIVDRDLGKAAEKYWKRLVTESVLTPDDMPGLLRAKDSGGAGLFPGAYYESASVLDDWLPKDCIFLLPDAARAKNALEKTAEAWGDHLQEGQESLCQPQDLVLRPVKEVLALFTGATHVLGDDLGSDLEEEPGNFTLQERSYHSFQELFPKPEASDRPWRHLVAYIKEWPVRNGKLILSFTHNRARNRFLKLAEQDGIFPALRYSEKEQGVFALVSPFRRGLRLPWDNTLIMGEDVLQPRVEKARRVPGGAFKGLDRYDTLREGDFLVHRDYGVAVFGGLHRMNLGGTENDFLLLYYAGEDKLYLPVDRLSLIQRFKGADGARPAPDRLGGSLWSVSKDKAKKAIEKIAADLVEMYALRKVVKGFRYGPVDEIYREFEASFGFEETPDQARAIEEVLADMEKPEPMDRLVCGDVGFGKTEVALRAAFRAAMESRQVAMLCPTTILAEQHFQTFKSRLAGFPVNVEMLSRFVSKARQKEILEAAARGQVDILIGTHRLLSKDVTLPNLGLLVLDEEQRFGVRHKERLKEMRKNVDALTLTATPIPRTLQLSLSGIRELSVIETPPPERKPVATALIDRDEATLKGILERELARQGQVFWVYNRVQGLERVAEYVKKLVPDARLALAHGQMAERDLEEAMRKFWQGEADVLVCTAIIESGLDFPRANTLIVDQAQLFGLGQLYQLRGRVGRSDRQAFAVFVTPDPDRLPDQARQRMRIILEMDYLGAGFQVAMEDLRLRGAGNILGESQTGHMNRLGLDLFLEMLEQAVAKLKGQPVAGLAETELTIGIPAFIPESYIQDRQERLRYYKQLSSSSDGQAQEEVEAEVRDRFGVFPPELVNFTAVLAFKRMLADFGVQKADIFPDKVKLLFGKESRVEPADLVAFVTGQQARGRNARLQPPAILELPLEHVKGKEEKKGGPPAVYADALEEIRKLLAGMKAAV